MGFISDWSASFKIYRAKFNGSWPAKLTAIWLLLVVGSSAVNWQSFSIMGPNEWGDFLAGTMSPIAFMWLVFGYLQQGRELKQNTEALHLQQKALLLQHEELAEQVKATLKVAAHSEQQAAAAFTMATISESERRARELDAIFAIQPKFNISFASTFFDSSGGNKFYIENIGRDARRLQISSESFETCEAAEKSISTGQKSYFILRRLKLGHDLKRFILLVRYVDTLGYVKEQRFNFIKGQVYYDDMTHVGKIGELAENAEATQTTS